MLFRSILRDGVCYPNGILNVDSFVNHQMDPDLMFKIAEEFVERFKGYPINKIITIEASGIAPAILVGYIMHLPVVFVKKKKPVTMEDMITSSVYSFTKKMEYNVCVNKHYITENDHLLFIDDFLANGNAAMGIIDLAQQVGATIDRKSVV